MRGALGARWLMFGGDRRGGKTLVASVCGLVAWLIRLGSLDPIAT